MDSSFRLLVDDGSPALSWSTGRADDVRVVPRGLSSLRSSGDDPVVLRRGAVAIAALAVRFDAVDDQRLLLAVPRGAAVRVNGAPAPLLSRLASGDRIDLPRGPTIHVSRERRGEPVPVPAELVGEPCGLCRVPLAEATEVWICGACGTALHLEPESIPERTRLTCARMASACPHCHGPVELEGGMDHVPQR